MTAIKDLHTFLKTAIVSYYAPLVSMQEAQKIIVAA
jgi:hypothetical protein